MWAAVNGDRRVSCMTLSPSPPLAEDGDSYVDLFKIREILECNVDLNVCDAISNVCSYIYCSAKINFYASSLSVIWTSKSTTINYCTWYLSDVCKCTNDMVKWYDSIVMFDLSTYLVQMAWCLSMNTFGLAWWKIGECGWLGQDVRNACDNIARYNIYLF